MKKTLSIAAILLLCAAAANAGLTYSGGTFTWTSTTTADSMVNAGSPTTNFGDSNQLNIASGASPIKSYMQFDLPDNGNFTTANIVGATFTLYKQSEANDTYHDMRSKSFLLAGLKEANEGWTESGITFNQAIQYYGSTTTAVGDSKYFVYKATQIDPLYPYDPTNPPAIQLTSTGTKIAWPADNSLVSNTWNLIGDLNMDQRDPNLRWNFLNLIDDDTDDSLTIMMGPNNSLYFLSKEDGDGSSAPMITITFVPEPATLSLLVLGAAAALRRKRN